MTASEQARADAMADAETLRLHTESLWSESARRYVGHGARTAWLIEEAGLIGPQIANGLDGWRARWCADAAFRAVPGLRS